MKRMLERELFAKSRDDLYQADDLFDGKTIVVLAGSRVIMNNNSGYKPFEKIRRIRDDRFTVASDGIVL